MKKQEILDSLQDLIVEIDADREEAKQMVENLITELKQCDIHVVRKSFPLIEGETKSNIKKYNGLGRQAPPPPPVRTIKGNVS